jgi:hypothetical protein
VTPVYASAQDDFATFVTMAHEARVDRKSSTTDYSLHKGADAEALKRRGVTAVANGERRAYLADKKVRRRLAGGHC